MNEDKLKKYAEYRFELWSLLAEKSCIVLESELDEIQYLVLKNREYIKEDDMKTLEQLEQQLKEVQQQIDEMKNDDFIIQAEWQIENDFSGASSLPDMFFYFKKRKYFNVFKTQDQAEKMARKLNAYLKLWHIAQYLNEGWEPDWSNSGQEKYSIYIDYPTQKTCPVSYYSVTEFSVFFKTKELVEKAIQMMGEQSLKDYFS